MNTSLNKTAKQLLTEATQSDAYKAVQQLVIEHPAIKKAIHKIEECRFSSKGNREPDCLVILGDSGVGKTTIKDLYVSRNPRRELQEGTKIPVLSVTIPVPATMMTLVTALLNSLGDPLAGKGTLHGKTMRLHKLLKECEVEMILLDEFHHFIDRDKEKVLQSVSDWLKNLISVSKIPITLIGLKSSTQILRSNKQLYRRFSNVIQVAPLRYPSSKNKDFVNLLKMIQKNIPLKFEIDLSSTDIAERIYAATNGFISQLMTLIRVATLISEQAGNVSITQSVLEIAFERKLKTLSFVFHKRGRDIPENPFAPNWSLPKAVSIIKKTEQKSSKKKPKLSKAAANRKMNDIFSQTI